MAFSCKGRGVCPSCNTRRMVEAAAHLTDHVFPCLPVRQHSGFSVDTSVRIEAHVRAALERLLRYCARPAFSMERLRKAGTKLAASLLRRAGTELAAQGCGHGYGAGSTFATGQGAARTKACASRRRPAVDLDDHHVYVSLGCAAEKLVQAALGNGLIADVRLGRGPLMPKSLRRDLPSVLV